MNKPKLLATDLEGVLIPEVWQKVAEITGAPGLRLTTRDVKDYDQLMAHRLKTLAEEGITMQAIEAAIAEMDPFPGATDYLDKIRKDRQVIILSDSFYEFARPFMSKLGWPTLFCHSLEVDGGGEIAGYRLRLQDGKRHAVRGFKALGFEVACVGDSYNDVTMLAEADEGILFRAPSKVRQEFSQYPAYAEYHQVLGHLGL